MRETQALQNIREQIITDLTGESQPEGVQEELLDALHAVDRQLGGTTLFVIEREYYRAPTTQMDLEDGVLMTQERTLF